MLGAAQKLLDEKSIIQQKIKSNIEEARALLLKKKDKKQLQGTRTNSPAEQNNQKMQNTLELNKLFEKSPNFYELLKIERSATGSEIKKAFQKMAKVLHPDKNSGQTSKKPLSSAFSDAPSDSLNPLKTSVNPDLCWFLLIGLIRAL